MLLPVAPSTYHPLQGPRIEGLVESGVSVVGIFDYGLGKYFPHFRHLGHFGYLYRLYFLMKGSNINPTPHDPKP